MTKKTESLELRLSPELKDALSNVSKSRGAPMSQIVRSLVEREVNGGSQATIAEKGSIMTNPTFARVAAASVIILGIASLSLVAETSPASAGATARMTFAEFDRDGDGAVTPDEFNAVMTGWDADIVEEDDAFVLPAACDAVFDNDADEEIGSDALFAEYDLDQNGTVSFAEVKIATEAQLTIEFQDADQNGDGLLSMDEATDRPLTVAELVAAEIPNACAEALVAQDAEMRAEHDGEFDDPVEQRIQFAAMDVNLDGHITMTEYLENN